MPDVTGSTKKKPSGPYWYWTELGPRNVNLVDKKEDLPAGTYELFWEFRGKPGETLEATLTDSSGRLLTTLTDTIPPHDSESWGQKQFKVLT